MISYEGCRRWETGLRFDSTGPAVQVENAERFVAAGHSHLGMGAAAAPWTYALPEVTCRLVIAITACTERMAADH